VVPHKDHHKLLCWLNYSQFAIIGAVHLAGLVACVLNRRVRSVNIFIMLAPDDRAPCPVDHLMELTCHGYWVSSYGREIAGTIRGRAAADLSGLRGGFNVVSIRSQTESDQKAITRTQVKNSANLLKYIRIIFLSGYCG